VRTTTGDAQRVCDLFGPSVNAAVRYNATVDTPGVIEVALPTRKPLADT
jgi:hypothetical protein